MSSSAGGEPLRPAAPRVVIADDDAVFRSGVRAALQDAGIVVIAEADNGRDAIDLAVHFRPDVVLMDVVMVGMDGISATRAIAGARARGQRRAADELAGCRAGDDRPARRRQRPPGQGPRVRGARGRRPQRRRRASRCWRRPSRAGSSSACAPCPTAASACARCAAR